MKLDFQIEFFLHFSVCLAQERRIRMVRVGPGAPTCHGIRKRKECQSSTRPIWTSSNSWHFFARSVCEFVRTCEIFLASWQSRVGAKATDPCTNLIHGQWCCVRPATRLHNESVINFSPGSSFSSPVLIARCLINWSDLNFIIFAS